MHGHEYQRIDIEPTRPGPALLGVLQREPRAALSGRLHAVTPAEVLAMQRVAGNARTCQMLASPQVVQRRASPKEPLTADDIAELKRVGNRTIRELARLERERAITTVEAQREKAQILELMRRAKAGRGDRQEVVTKLDRLRVLPERARRRAAAARSTKGRKLISRFRLEPPVIRISEHEAARVSFVVKGAPKSINAQILEHDGPGAGYRFFTIESTSGYHQLIWDGTFTNQPPEPGVYRIVITVTGADDRTEGVWDQIRVENPGNKKVMPRPVASGGHAVSTLTFDGKTLVLTDDANNTIEVPATSGLKPTHHKNPAKIDYTDPKWEWEPGKGPIPRGNYDVKPGQFQLPNADARGTKYASGRRASTAAIFGPMRAHITPDPKPDPSGKRTRGEFFIHLDVTNDGTAGCIGIPPAAVGKFNQIMSLIATSKKDIKLAVTY
jgi:hypothetical protein